MLENFRTDPENKNPMPSAARRTRREISWSGFFYIDPLRSWGELTLDNLSLNKYAPCTRTVPFEIRDGVVGVHVEYRLELNPTNVSWS